MGAKPGPKGIDMNDVAMAIESIELDGRKVTADLIRDYIKIKTNGERGGSKGTILKFWNEIKENKFPADKAANDNEKQPDLELVRAFNHSIKRETAEFIRRISELESSNIELQEYCLDLELENRKIGEIADEIKDQREQATGGLEAFKEAYSTFCNDLHRDLAMAYEKIKDAAVLEAKLAMAEKRIAQLEADLKLSQDQHLRAEIEVGRFEGAAGTAMQKAKKEGEK